jgi:serine/threonine protein kinase
MPGGPGKGPPATQAKRIEILDDPEQLDQLFEFLDEGDDDGTSVCRAVDVQARGDGQEYTMKIRNKAYVQGANEVLFRRLTEKMMNMPASAHLLKVHACYEDADDYYTLLEVCRGGDLVSFYRNRLEPEGDPGKVESRVRTVIHQALRALRCLHAEGLVHRDVKLETLMYNFAEEAQTTFKLVDYDYCEEWDSGSSSPESSSSFLQKSLASGIWSHSRPNVSSCVTSSP